MCLLFISFVHQQHFSSPSICSGTKCGSLSSLSEHDIITYIQRMSLTHIFKLMWTNDRYSDMLRCPTIHITVCKPASTDRVSVHHTIKRTLCTLWWWYGNRLPSGFSRIRGETLCTTDKLCAGCPGPAGRGGPAPCSPAGCRAGPAGRSRSPAGPATWRVMKKLRW